MTSCKRRCFIPIKVQVVEVLLRDAVESEYARNSTEAQRDVLQGGGAAPQRRAACGRSLCVRCPSKLARPLLECLGRAEEGAQAHLLMARQVMRCRKVMDMVPHHQIGIKSQRMGCGR